MSAKQISREISNLMNEAKRLRTHKDKIQYFNAISIKGERSLYHPSCPNARFYAGQYLYVFFVVSSNCISGSDGIVFDNNTIHNCSRRIKSLSNYISNIFAEFSVANDGNIKEIKKLRKECVLLIDTLLSSQKTSIIAESLLESKSAMMVCNVSKDRQRDLSPKRKPMTSHSSEKIVEEIPTDVQYETHEEFVPAAEMSMHGNASEPNATSLRSADNAPVKQVTLLLPEPPLQIPVTEIEHIVAINASSPHNHMVYGIKFIDSPKMRIMRISSAYPTKSIIYVMINTWILVKDNIRDYPINFKIPDEFIESVSNTPMETEAKGIMLAMISEANINMTSRYVSCLINYMFHIQFYWHIRHLFVILTNSGDKLGMFICNVLNIMIIDSDDFNNEEKKCAKQKLLTTSIHDEVLSKVVSKYCMNRIISFRKMLANSRTQTQSLPDAAASNINIAP